MSVDNDRIAVFVVNFNGGDMLPRCLHTIHSQSLRPVRVIVVDNGSTDGSVDIAESLFPDFEYIRLDRNIGFAAANNHAVYLATDCKWLALLNPDAYAAPDWLERMMAAACKNPEYSVFGSCMYINNNSLGLDGIGDIYHASGLAWREGHGLIVTQGSIEAREIFSPCAAAALYRREVFTSVGGLDEDFFCYYEDVDFGFRLRLAGYRCMLVPDAVVYHKGSATTGGQRGDFAVYHGHRNLVWAYVKNMPGVLFWLLLPLHIALNLLTIVWFSLHGQGFVILRAKRDALFGIPRMLEKRRSIQKHRTASIGEIWKALDKRFLPRWLQMRRMIS
jgi:GT2 family glycosyltransferase